MEDSCGSPVFRGGMMGCCCCYSKNATGWTIWGSNHSSARDVALLQNVHTSSGAHSASCFLFLYSFQSVINVTPATSQSKYSSICSLHTLTNLYSSPYLIQLLQVRSIYIYILQQSVHYWSSKTQQPNLKRNRNVQLHILIPSLQYYF